MNHPLEEASLQIKPFSTTFKCLIKRTLSSLKHSMSRYTDFREELSELYNIPLSNTSEASWNEEQEKIKQWAISKSKESIWSSEQIHCCFKNLKSACIYTTAQWNDLTDTLEHIESTPSGSPSKSRLTQRLAHESDQIEQQILCDIVCAEKMYLSIKKLLVEANCTHFRLNLSLCKLQIQERPHLEKGMILSDLELSEIDFRSQPLANVTLKNCLFTKCLFSKKVQDNVKLITATYMKCTGSMSIKASQLSVSIIECQFSSLTTSNCLLELNLEKSTLESCSISGSCKITSLIANHSQGGLLTVASTSGGHIKLSASHWKSIVISPQNNKSDSYALSFNKTTVEKITLSFSALEYIKSHDSSLIINANNTSIKSLDCTQTRYHLSCMDSRINTLNSVNSVAKIMSNNTFIENQFWSNSTVFQLKKETNEKKNDVCSVDHGKMECHRLESKQQCIIIHKGEHIYNYGTVEPDHQTIGKLLRILDIKPLSSAIQQSDLDVSQFQFEQVIFLLKYNIQLSDSYLTSAICSNQPSKAYLKTESFNKGLTEVLKQKIISRVNETPSFVRGIIDSMDNRCVMYFLGVLNLTHQESNTQKYGAISGTQMDNIVYHHFIKTLSLLSPYSTSLKRPLSQLRCTDAPIIQIFMILDHLPKILAKTHRKQGLFDHTLSHLLLFGSWYIKIKTKAEILSSSLIQLLAEDNTLHEPFIQTLKDLLTSHSSLIGLQKLFISSEIQSQVQSYRHNPFLKPIETYLASESLKKFSFNSLSLKYCSIMLDNIANILRSYRPLFPWHITGRRKRDTIEFLIDQFNDPNIQPKNLLSKLYRYIEYLLGGKSSPDSIQYLQHSLSLNQGRTRKKTGYLMTLKIARHLLSNAICERSFHFPTNSQSTDTNSFFENMQTPAQQAKRIVSEFATTHINSTVTFISAAVSDSELSSQSQLLVSKTSELNLNDQLKLSLYLAKRLSDIKDWSEQEIKGFMILWFHHQRRNHGYASKIHSIHLTRGLCFLKLTEAKDITSSLEKSPNISHKKEIELTSI